MSYPVDKLFFPDAGGATQDSASHPNRGTGPILARVQALVSDGRTSPSTNADEGRKQNNNKACLIWTVFVIVTVTR